MADTWGHPSLQGRPWSVASRGCAASQGTSERACPAPPPSPHLPSVPHFPPGLSHTPLRGPWRSVSLPSLGKALNSVSRDRLLTLLTPAHPVRGPPGLGLNAVLYRRVAFQNPPSQHIPADHSGWPLCLPAHHPSRPDQLWGGFQPSSPRPCPPCGLVLFSRTTATWAPRPVSS